MKIFPAKPVLFLTLTILAFTACTSSGENKTANQNARQTNRNSANNANATKDDPAELGKIINLPFQPEEVAWREENVTTPDKKSGQKLTAVFRFLHADAVNLIAQAEKHKPVEGSQIDPEDWFPAELVAQSQLSGDETLKGNAFAPNDFLQEPYKNGKLTHIPNTDYFVLEITSF